MLDDLRGGNDFSEEEEEELIAIEESELATSSGGTFLGMTAVQRMILSILLFLMVTVFGVLLLFATGRIGI